MPIQLKVLDTQWIGRQLFYQFPSSSLRIISIAVILFAGCHKGDKIIKDSPLDFTVFSNLVDGDTVKNYIVLDYSQWLNAMYPVDSPYRISVTARFTNPGGTAINAGALSIADRSCAMTPSGDYLMRYNDSASTVKNNAVFQMGSTINVGVAGSSGVEAFNQPVYVPKKLVPFSFKKPTHGNVPFPLTWTPDNTSSNKIVIYVRLVRTSGAVQDSDVKRYITDDDGSFLLADKVFLSYPAGSDFTITFGRISVTEVVTPGTGRKTHIFGLVQASTGRIRKI